MTTRRISKLRHSLIFLYMSVPSLSPDSEITNLHIFRFLSYSFLLLAGRWQHYSCRCCLQTYGSQHVRTRRQKRIFTTWINPGNLVSGTKFCGTPRRSSLKQVNLGPSSENGHESWDCSPFNTCSVCTCVTTPWEIAQVQTLPFVPTCGYTFHLCVTLAETCQWPRSL